MNKLIIIALVTIGLIPFITYLDYYLLKDKAICPRCGLEPPKHHWLLATTLEVYCLIIGLLIGSGII